MKKDNQINEENYPDVINYPSDENNYDIEGSEESEESDESEESKDYNSTNSKESNENSSE